MAASKDYSSARNAQQVSKSSKTVTFYINGNRDFQGHVMAITSRRFRDIEVLLSELCSLSYFKDLPLGVRYLFSLESGTKVESLEQLTDGKAYVCSSYSRLKKVSYGAKLNLPNWGSRQHLQLPGIDASRETTKRRASGDAMGEETRQRGHPELKLKTTDGKITVKPKIVTIIRNGRKPRALVKALLNKRTAQNLDQVLNDVSHSIGNAGGVNVRRLYTVEGQLIQDVTDLFRDENNVFIAVGNEKFRPYDIPDMLEGLEQGQMKQNGRHLPKQPKDSNEGMFKQRDVKVNQRPEGKVGFEGKKELVQGEQDNTSSKRFDENKLPKLPDIHKKPDNKPSQENSKSHVRVKGLSYEKRVKQRGGEKKYQSPLKLPLIGNSNLVVKSEKENRANEDNAKRSYHDKHSTSLQNANVEPSEDGIVNKDEMVDKPADRDKTNRKSSVTKGFSSDKNNKKTSRDEHGVITEDEMKYGTITDKKVEDVYYIGKKIGDGNFAEVRECTDKITKKEFALKIVDKDKIRGKEQMIKDEIDIMRQCRHPNIVRMYDDFITTRHIYLVMELIKGGDLFDAISSSVKFSETVTRNYVKDMCKALAYLHKNRIVHRDLKPENLLVHKKLSGDTILKLADFGLAMEVKAPIFTVCGTPTYVAPEILEENGYGLKVDMWAAGVITYIMLCGFPPFRSAKRDQDELFDLIMEGEYEFLSPYWDNISNHAKDLISKLLVVKPSERYSAVDALSHEWVAHKSESASKLSREYLGDNLQARRKFKAAALAVQGAKRMENLAEQFHHQRGEKVIIT